MYDVRHGGILGSRTFKLMKHPINTSIRIYSYFFMGIKKPVKIEAANKMQSRTILQQILPTLPEEYQKSRVVGECVTVPLKGITEKYVKGVKYIWVGEDKSKDGWMEESLYLKAVKRK